MQRTAGWADFMSIFVDINAPDAFCVNTGWHSHRHLMDPKFSTTNNGSSWSPVELVAQYSWQLNSEQTSDSIIVKIQQDIDVTSRAWSITDNKPKTPILVIWYFCMRSDRFSFNTDMISSFFFIVPTCTLYDIRKNFPSSQVQLFVVFSILLLLIITHRWPLLRIWGNY